jgi:NADPH-dependent glutamate synthase beta subunit-like oxidoreductase
MEQYWDCSLCKVEPKAKAFRCRFCSGKLKGRERLLHEIRGDRVVRPRGAVLSGVAAGLGQFYSGRWATGVTFAVLIPLCLGLLWATWSNWSYSHFFIVGSALFALLVASADAFFGVTETRAPCQKTCPAGLPIPDYLQLIIDGDLEQGYHLIRTRLPLVGIIGRVCPHPCETDCFRGVDGEPIAINGCKRYLADHRRKGLKNGKITPTPVSAPPADGPKVAVVGAGPSGLSCAYYLTMLGAKVTVFDAEPEPGGRLLTSIPDFRLPRTILREEVDDLRRMGVEFQSGARVGPGGKPVADLLKEHGAVYLAAGAPESLTLRVEGAESFLDFQKLLWSAKTETPIRLEGKVAVIGGGNAAIDVCRTALRCGASEVHLLYRRTRREMPAREDEVEAAMREGVEIHYLVNPIRGVMRDGTLMGLEVVSMELGGIDKSGRPQPIPVKGSQRVMEFSTVIPCLGQSVRSPLFDDPALKPLVREKDGRLRVHPRAQRTNIARVYAGGDVARGAQTAVAAIADGRRAALAIFADIAPEKVNAPRARLLRLRHPFPGHVETPQEKIREEMRCIPLTGRSDGFAEVEEGLYPSQAAHEAKRCLQCHREL